MTGSGFGARVAGGAAWSYAAHAIGRAAVLAGLAATAHVLTPHEFGVFAMAMVAVNLLDVVKDFGLRPALVYLLGTDESGDVVDTAFVASLALGAALTSLMLALAGPTGAFYGDATVTDLRAKGIEVAEPESPDGSADFLTTWITDPDGNRIELVQWPAGHPDGLTAADWS